MKKTAKRIVLSAVLLSLAGVVPSQAIVAENQRELDIIVRDFPVTHPDFENFQEEAYNSIANGSKNRDIGDLTTWHSSYTTDTEWMKRRSQPDVYGCGNTQSPSLGIAIGTLGYPKDLASETGSKSTVPDYVAALALPANTPQGYAWYGEFSNCQPDTKLNPLGLKVMRGLVADLCSDDSDSWAKNMADKSKQCTKTCKTHGWSQIVYITPGMVKEALYFPKDAEGNLDMYSPTILKNRDACDNGLFEQWYADSVAGTKIEGIAHKRTNTTLILDQDPTDSKYFEIDKNWNNGGYFPLDSISDDGKFTWMGSKPQYPNQFGAQSLSIFCPPYQYQWASTQTDFMGDNTAKLCNAWIAAGGPKNGDAAQAATLSDPTLGQRHLRNYGFTMMGYAAFKYKKGAGEVFKFTGDDDMWIYVDGVLVVDLGGTHLAAAGTANMDYLAANSHGCHFGDPLADSCATKIDAAGVWKDESWHHIHFFYADRQTDGSNLRIRSSLSELAPSRYGQPAANNVSVKNETREDGTTYQAVSMLLNTELDMETYQNIAMKGATQPAIIVMRTEKDASGNTVTKTYGFYIESISGPENKGAKGQLYQMNGTLKDAAGNVVETGILGSDLIAFNFPLEKYSEIANDDELKGAYVSAVGAETWAELLQWASKMSFEVKSTSGKAVVGFPDTPTGDDWAIVQFIPSGNKTLAPVDTTITRPDFAESQQKLQDMAGSGELSNEFTADLILTPLPTTVGKGDPTKMSDEEYKQYGSSDPAVTTATNRTSVVGGNPGNPGESNGLCFSQNGVESCTNFSKVISGPSRISVRVFDNMGHFVSQYQMTITEEMLRNALGKTNKQCYNNGVANDVYGDTGYLLLSAKMYPVSQNGRMLATGPYIYQVTVVEEKYASCVVSNGSPQWLPIDYSRTAETYVRGYRRLNK
ncbi:fibro-slime domain-containing protein [Fibrobacter sp. UWEL]|uniref:fibro-slime domain-containing protein n=1 Tax=Fibrobacter sp. UWEL TaxID=1896209 RepID=UPI000915C125|nr:fibro-slime domain-containing protein [Fibrobacter sp. UWEL]SHK54878.1 fibro-slime domain-containing protein [Fibrobacter sp. UWEL]